MKILNLKFKNINSLSGENEIDFTNAIFSNEGLFAITGKTGSGKSSILDAISLALYGKTPRVEITGGENAVMTRGEKDCYAEIIFEVSGKKWKSSWKQEMRKTGTLKQVERVIADENDLIVADKISIKGDRKNEDEKTVNEKIIEILGLTFEQFTKVILLAQGSFAAFLQAKQNEKGELLEQITGTEIYGIVSQTVFEKNREEKEKLEKIALELLAIKVLTPEEINNLKVEIKQLEENTQHLDLELENIENAKKWITDLQQLMLQIQNIKTKLPELEVITHEKKEQWDQSVAIVKTAKEQFSKLEPVLIMVRELEIKISEKEKLLQPILKSIQDLENQKIKITEILEKQNKNITIFQESLEQKKEWEIKNQKLESLVSAYSAIEKEAQLVQQSILEISKLQIDSDQFQKKHDVARLNTEKSVTTLHVKEKTLSEQRFELETLKNEVYQTLGGRELIDLQSEKEQINHLIIQFEKLIEVENQIAIDQKNIIELSSKLEQWEKEIEEKGIKNKEEKEVVVCLENEIMLIEENIQLTKRIQSLEEHRNHLKDGEVCPLCGSFEHPYAMGNIPEVGAKEEELKKLKTTFQSKTSEIQQTEKVLAKLMADKSNGVINIENTVINKNVSIEKRESILEEIKHVAPNIESTVLLNDIYSLGTQKQDYQVRLKRIHAIIVKATETEISISKLRDHEIPNLEVEYQKAIKDKSEAETEQKLIKQQVDSQLFFLHTVKEKQKREEAELSQKLYNYDVEDIIHLKIQLDLWGENRTLIGNLNHQINESKNYISLNDKELENTSKLLEEKKSEKDSIEKVKQKWMDERKEIFGDQSVEEVEFRLKKELVTKEMDHHRLGEDLTAATLELEKGKAIIGKTEEEFKEKEALQITELTIDELQVELNEKRGLREQQSQKIGANNQTLKANGEFEKENHKKLKEKEHQQEICNRWAKLNELIGSADGKKYRNFAQALTFEHLISISNKQLLKMSDRYLLKRSGDSSNPFELSVIDKFQNNEERTAQNLSGGEKFIVSLSLALGLANMASKNMSIDTMFIDEGFGTLDSDYLDVALNALSNLQSEGKIIGVISHLTELKERIATHIEVVPSGNGHSKIRVG